MGSLLDQASVYIFAIGVAMIIFTAPSSGAPKMLVEKRFCGQLMAFYSRVFIGSSQAVGFFLGALASAVGAGSAFAMTAVVLIRASLTALRRTDVWRVV